VTNRWLLIRSWYDKLLLHENSSFGFSKHITLITR